MLDAQTARKPDWQLAQQSRSKTWKNKLTSIETKLHLTKTLIWHKKCSIPKLSWLEIITMRDTSRIWPSVRRMEWTSLIRLQSKPQWWNETWLDMTSTMQTKLYTWVYYIKTLFTYLLKSKLMRWSAAVFWSEFKGSEVDFSRDSYKNSITSYILKMITQ